MSIWTVTNLKPGTAKTTSAVWLAHALHEMGHRVLLVGADPGGARLKMAPDLSDGMGSAERWNARAPMPFDVISLATRDLHRTLPTLAADYKFTVVDSPPIEDHQGIAISALRAADVAIIPVAPTTVEIDRMAPVLHVIEEVNALRSEDLPTCVLLNRCVSQAASTGEAATVLAEQGHHVLETRIPRLELFAQSHGAPVLAKGTAYEEAAIEILTLKAPAA
ncbi:ParA family protein [Nonomuraea sp. 3-1Str]|uniref:ParA family protein n=1 Tax=Nonomuraea sp. 3-1Str TaxID=2929801 RepID=UPI0028545C6C|nr:ParA family protein [Nonomuraea sp. 3-1Str]MDR8415064.1 ParA family protein [Nonomuraea sp. 3-1Str]